MYCCYPREIPLAQSLGFYVYFGFFSRRQQLEKKTTLQDSLLGDDEMTLLNVSVYPLTNRTDIQSQVDAQRHKKEQRKEHWENKAATKAEEYRANEKAKMSVSTKSNNISCNSAYLPDLLDNVIRILQ